MVEKRQLQLAANGEAMERWLRKLIRAANEVDRLRAQRKRLLKPAKLPAEATAVPSSDVTDVDVFGLAAELARGVKDDGLDIPVELDRNRKLQAMADPRTKEKKAERKVVAKEKLAAELTGKRRAMPLTGKAALDAIRNG